MHRKQLPDGRQQLPDLRGRGGRVELDPALDLAVGARGVDALLQREEDRGGHQDRRFADGLGVAADVRAIQTPLSIYYMENH